MIELNQSGWLAAGAVPGIERQPLKKLDPDELALLRLLLRWQDKASRAGCTITQIAVTYEAGRDGFWLARWRTCKTIWVERVFRNAPNGRMNRAGAAA